MKLQCFYCPQMMDGYGISVKCPDCPNSPTYNALVPSIVFFNDIKRDGTARAEYNIKKNISTLFIKKEPPNDGYSFSSIWSPLTELNFQITPTNIQEVLDKCLKLKTFL